LQDKRKLTECNFTQLFKRLVVYSHAVAEKYLQGRIIREAGEAEISRPRTGQRTLK